MKLGQMILYEEKPTALSAEEKKKLLFPNTSGCCRRFTLSGEDVEQTEAEGLQS